MDKTSTELKHLKSDDQIVIPIEKWREYQERLKNLEQEVRDCDDDLRKQDKRIQEGMLELAAWEDSYRKLYAIAVQDMSGEYSAMKQCLITLRTMVVNKLGRKP